MCDCLAHHSPQEDSFRKKMRGFGIGRDVLETYDAAVDLEAFPS